MFKNIEFHDFTLSNETILATKQEFFFTKVVPVRNITDIALFDFSLIVLPAIFISYYSIIYFFVIFFSNVYISVNTIFECYLSFGWEIGYLLSMCVTRWLEGGHPKCLQMCTGGGRYHASCVRTHLHYRFSCFCLMVSCFICRNLTLCVYKKLLFF